MFTKPISYTRITAMEELLKYSYRTDKKAEPMIMHHNNGQTAFTDEYGAIWVTPRSEAESILTSVGYVSGDLSVPFSNGEERPIAYKWLAKIADEEDWAETYEMAFKISCEKGIKPVNLKQKVHVKQVDYWIDEEFNTSYHGMITKFLLNCAENIGTYILIDEKTVMLCDEYGRTFLVKVKTVINDVVNALIDAGYTRTAHPEFYINEYKTHSEEFMDSEE